MIKLKSEMLKYLKTKKSNVILEENKKLLCKFNKVV